MKIESQKPNLKNRIKNVTLEIILSSTSHGLPNIFRSSNLYIKLMWIFFTLISTGLLGCMVTQNIMNYFKYEVTTKTRVKTEFKSTFPTITVCNINTFTSEHAANYIKTIEYNKFDDNPLAKSFEFMAKSYKPKNNSILYGDSLDKLLVFCEYETHRCNMSQVRYYNHPEYGDCYMINSGYDYKNNPVNLWSAMAPKRHLGLNLILNISVHDELKFLSPNYGAIVIIHNNTVNPFVQEGITLSPKIESNIALTKTFFSSQPKPYSDCDGKTDDPNEYNSELFKLIHKNGGGYSQFLCLGLCFQRSIVNKCGCSVVNFPSFFEVRSCFLNEDINCMNNQLNEVIESNYIMDVCYKECPLECEGMKFEKTVSFNQFSNDKWIEYMQNYDKHDSIYFNKTINSDELAAVRIYYETISYTNIEEKPTTMFVDLLSSIGGVAGLFLGVSVLSFVEIIECLMQIIFIMINYKKVSF
ncbi:unnamed protein product [Brachionus calyciflorus]|uniref:Uncharacterized protein n=1 Tax=Brachionus calyciflorus TaxID=104777 RepID=A0A813YJR1_9BILA|nr:unnamed protein product [Brachionus calyciflorus]